jgi:hypothetical protein
MSHNQTTNNTINNNTQQLASTKNKLSTIDSVGTIPSPRFGHSLNLITQTMLILFGGAIGDTKTFKFSNDTFLYNLNTKIWMQLKYLPYSSVPEPRAAHAAAANENSQLVIHSGSVGNTKSNEDDLWLFDLDNTTDINKQGVWKKIPTTGKTPGKRYGHSLAYLKPYFVLFGGNVNSKLTNDVWLINLNNVQFSWQKIDFAKKRPEPLPRLYHAVGFSQSGNVHGMMILYGGRDKNEMPLGDIWGLRKHRDGTWDWIQAAIIQGNTIQARYNHSIEFYGPLMIVLGGRNKNVSEILPIEVYDTDNSETYQFLGIGRYRQSTILKGSSLYIYGGFKSTNPNEPLDSITHLDLHSLFNGSLLFDKFVTIGELLEKNKRYGNNIRTDRFVIDTNNGVFRNSINSGNSSSNSNSNSNNKNIKFKLASEAVVGKIISDNMGHIDDAATLFMKVSIENLPDETKRIGQEKALAQLQKKRRYNHQVIDKFIDNLLRPFDWYSPEMDEVHKKLPFTPEDINTLFNEVLPLIQNDSSLIKLRSPCKVFGNLYGRYNDLMRFFESFGHPSDEGQMGDIYVMQYIFLGDFCDRGCYSLEVVFLLLALKVKYPEYIYLIRGHHEDIAVNGVCGLGEEFKERLCCNLTNEHSIFMKLNLIFNYLPLAVLIDEQILCVHGGIGNTLSKLEEIEQLKRPIQVNQEPQTVQDRIVRDLLWSEYDDTLNDVVDMNVNDNKRMMFNNKCDGDRSMLVYGKERLDLFLNKNQLSLLICSHQWIFEGVKAFNNDKLIIVYSSTNYMNVENNPAGILTIAKRTVNRPMQIIPKLINVFEYDKGWYKSNVKLNSPLRNKK